MKRTWLRLLFYLYAIDFEVANAYLNLYLSLTEVQRLLGLEMQLFYVREGVVNDYALNFVVLVPSKIDTLNFSWQSLTGRPLPYSIEVDVSKTIALAVPKLNISSTGVVPTSLDTFSVNLLCTGLTKAEINVVLTVNVTLAPTNVTSLKIKRKKICVKAEPSSNGHVLVDPAPLNSNSVNIFYTAVGSAISLIAILALCITGYYLRHKKTRRSSDDNRTQGHMTYLTAANRNPTSTSSYGSFRRMPSYSHIDEQSKDLQERIAELTIQRCRVRLHTVVLEGTFGRVYVGTYTEDNRSEEVLVKTVTDHASQVQISLLLQEGMFMYSLTHKNILSIRGVSIEDQTPPFLLYPYHGYKNLKVFLQKCKLNSEGVAHTLTTQEVVDMALQVIQAMQFLHKKYLWHKDLAARNCVVDDKLKIKVTDNALSRDLFPSDYHCLGDNENRPIKWMAIESLLQKEFSPSSDVWSFGVLLWELTTLAQQPYVEIDPFEMAAYLKDGYRLAQPINCPDELFAVMAYCWAMSSEERPTFSQLQVCLQEFYAQLIRYV